MRTFIPTLVGVVLGLTTLSAPSAPSAPPPNDLLNVSYDVSRGFFREFNLLFVSHHARENGQTVTVRQSHGGSGKQARAVIDGLEGDVLTMNSALDIDIVSGHRNLIDPNWRNAFPHRASPSWSTTLFIVRKGNPQNIRDWNDLTRKDVSVVIPNPKTSGNGRYSYLAAWIYGLENGGDEQGAADFVRRLFRNVPILDGGGRGATTSFTQRGIGDVLLTFESEVNLVLNEFGSDKFEVVVPSVSVRADNPVAVITGVTERHGKTALAQAYLGYLYSNKAQALYVKHGLRPATDAAWQQYRDRFPDLRIVDIESTLDADWLSLFEKHFRDGGTFDQIVSNQP